MFKKLFIVAFALIVATPALGQVYIEVFVTNETFPSPNSLSSADSLCQAEAEAASLPGTWTAWISNSSTDAQDRITDGIYRLRTVTTVVANSKADLTDGTLNNAINLNASGGTETGGVWTGTAVDGTEGTSHCTDWGVHSADTATIGDSSATDSTWTDNGTSTDCLIDTKYRYYCFHDQLTPVELQKFSIE